MGTPRPNRRQQQDAPVGPPPGPPSQRGPRHPGLKSSIKASKPLKLSFAIPSDFEAGEHVQQEIMRGIRDGGFDADSTFAIRISLEEALVNAIKHGNRSDPRKKVHVEAHVAPGHAEIVVEDEGPGFDRSAVPDPTAEENLCRPSGRGILLIESYMTDVKWERGGRRVRMVKRSG